MVLTLLSWALASPVGSSPDDDFHLTSIWCGNGEKTGTCEMGTAQNSRVVPADLAYSICFAYNPEMSGACQSETLDSGNSGTFETDRGNFATLYPPVFYYTMNFLVGPSVTKSVLLMRLFNTLLLTALAAILFTFLPRRYKPTAAWTYLITLVPLGMFILPSTNPSSWTLMAASGLFLSLVGAFRSTGRPKLILYILAGVCTILGAGARGDQGAFNILAIGAALLFSRVSRRRRLMLFIYPVILGVVNLVFFFSTAQSSVIESGLVDGKTASDLPTVNLILANLLEMPNLWLGIFGSWGLGWLDTPMPAVVWVAGLAAFIGLGFTALRDMSAKKLSICLALLAAMWLIPTYVLVKTNALVGAYVQPRYILPLIVLFTAVLLFRESSNRLSLTRVQTFTLVGSIGLANSLALHFNLSRYLRGTDVRSWNLDSGIEWWWKLPVSPMTIWILGSLAFLALLAISGQLLAPKALPGSKFGLRWMLTAKSTVSDL